MSDTQPFGLLILATAGSGLAAVLANRFSDRVKVPLPAFFLAAAAVASLVIPQVHAPPHRTVERVVSIALVLILFDGGLHIGWRRFRAAAAPIVAMGVLGTFGTVLAAAAIGHYAFGLSWFLAVLVATAISPTDPAVVFSVLGQREIAGRSSTILEGESGANDPVGIALMVSLIAAGELSTGAFVGVGVQFLLQMAIGALVGVVGGRVLLWAMRRFALPSEGLYPLRTLATVLVIFGLASVVHGSGFLAVFIAGILLGDARAPYKREIERFHTALASLGEIVAFVVLGLTVDLHELVHRNVLVPGLVLGAALALVIRPLVGWLCLAGARLRPNELTFVLFAGLKGAVPILLGSFLLEADVPDAPRLYGIVIVVVTFSVVLQGSLVPFATRLLRLPVSITEPEPWSLGVRLRDEPDGVHRLRVAAGAPADGASLAELIRLPEHAWVSFVVRDLQLLPVTAQTRLREADEVLVLADADLHAELVAIFETGTVTDARIADDPGPA
jgi:cell volume regulation protein A